MQPTFRHATLAVLFPVLWLAATAQPVTQRLNKASELEDRKNWPALLAHSLRWTKAQPGSGPNAFLLRYVNDGNWTLVKSRLELGTEPTGLDAQGETLLDHAKANNDKLMIALLELHGA